MPRLSTWHVLLALGTATCLVLLIVTHITDKDAAGTGAAVSKKASLGRGGTRTLCSNKKDTRHFISDRYSNSSKSVLSSRNKNTSSSTASRPLTLLYSFPGSGNTWLRLLLDYSTDIYSGSVYSDRSLYKILPGERRCDRSVSVIKAHPHLQTFAHFDKGDLPAKCKAIAGLPIHRLILLLRNPFDAIWSEFQRRSTRGSHSRVLAKDMLSDPLHLHKWMSIYKDLSARYVEMWGELEAFRRNGTEILLVRFEDLDGKEAARETGAGAGTSLQREHKERRERELERIVEFTGLDRRGASSKTGATGGTEAVRCAFTLADNPVAHRIKLDERKVLAKSDVYTTETVCDIWGTIGDKAKAAGYGIYGDTTCG